MRLTRGQISAAVDPLGWRLVLGAIYTQIAAASLEAAANAAAIAIAAAGADGDGHLIAEIQTARVLLRLQSATTGDVTEHDLALAHRLSDALAARSLLTEAGPVVLQNIEIAIDALDIARIRPFWQAVLGYVDEPGPPDLPAGALLDPLRRGPTIWFQQMDAPRPHEGQARSDPGIGRRNRIHIDVDLPPELAAPRIEAALLAGGTLVSADAAPAFWVLADPEGNEACICTWQGRD